MLRQNLIKNKLLAKDMINVAPNFKLFLNFGETIRNYGTDSDLP